MNQRLQEKLATMLSSHHRESSRLVLCMSLLVGNDEIGQYAEVMKDNNYLFLKILFDDILEVAFFRLLCAPTPSSIPSPPSTSPYLSPYASSPRSSSAAMDAQSSAAIASAAASSSFSITPRRRLAEERMEQTPISLIVRACLVAVASDLNKPFFVATQRIDTLLRLLVHCVFRASEIISHDRSDVAQIELEGLQATAEIVVEILFHLSFQFKEDTAAMAAYFLPPVSRSSVKMLSTSRKMSALMGEEVSSIIGNQTQTQDTLLDVLVNMQRSTLSARVGILSNARINSKRRTARQGQGSMVHKNAEADYVIFSSQCRRSVKYLLTCLRRGLRAIAATSSSSFSSSPPTTAARSFSPTNSPSDLFGELLGDECYDLWVELEEKSMSSFSPLLSTADFAGPRTKPPGSKKNVTVSHCLQAGQNDLVLKFVDLLSLRLKVEVWTSCTGSKYVPSLLSDHPSTGDRAMEAMDMSSLILIFVSREYRESASCRMEATYAAKLAEMKYSKVLFITIQSHYTTISHPLSIDGWLSKLLGAQTWYSLFEETHLEYCVEQVVEAVGGVGFNTVVLDKRAYVIPDSIEMEKSAYYKISK